MTEGNVHFLEMGANYRMNVMNREDIKDYCCDHGLVPVQCRMEQDRAGGLLSTVNSSHEGRLTALDA